MKDKISFKKIYSKLDDEEKQLIDAELSTCELEPKEMPLIRKGIEVREVEDIDDNTSGGWISTLDIDHSGDVVIPDGVILNVYNRNPVVFFNHDTSKQPIAKCTDIQIYERGIYAKWEYSETDEAKGIRKQVKDSFLNTLSIGFIPVAFKKKGQQGFKELGYPDADRVITKWVLLEFSIVSIPDNSNAIIVEKSLNEEIEEPLECPLNQSEENTTQDKEIKLEEELESKNEDNSASIKEVETKEIKKIKFKKIGHIEKVDVEDLVEKRLREVLDTKRGKLIFEQLTTIKT